MDLDNLIESRKSVKKFTSKKPDWRYILECADAMRHAPKAGNNCTLKIILVSDPEKIEKLAEASQQPFVSTAHYVLVVCSVPKILLNAYEEKNGEVYNRQQSGAAIQNFLLKIEEVGLATCWVGHFVEDQIKKTLSIPERTQVEAIFPIGFEAKIKGQKTTEKRRISLDKIIYFEKYGNKRMKKVGKMSA